MTEDEYLESLAMYRSITDTGPTYTLREVAELFGFDPDELAAEAEQEVLADRVREVARRRSTVPRRLAARRERGRARWRDHRRPGGPVP